MLFRQFDYVERMMPIFRMDRKVALL